MSIGGIWFCSQKAAYIWNLILERKLIHEKVLVPHNFKVLEVLEIVKATMLRLSLSAATPYGEQLVREVVTKLIRAFGDETHRRYGTLVVRLTKVYISPNLIINF